MVVLIASAGLVGAAQVDLSTSASAQATAEPGESVVVSVDYANNSAADPQRSIMSFYWPRGAYFDVDQDFVDAFLASFTDTRTNALVVGTDSTPNFYINGSCDGYLVQIYNNGTSTMDAPAGESGQYTLTIPMPMEKPGIGKFMITEPASVAGEYNFLSGDCPDDCDDPGGFSCMGTPVGLIETPVTAEVVIADDGTGESADGCEPFVNGAEVSGKIALVNRGVCAFGVKAFNAHNAGAVGTIIVNNEPNNSPGRISVGPTPGSIGVDEDSLGKVVTGPVVFITNEDGAPIAAAAASGTVMASIGRFDSDDVTFSSTVFHYGLNPPDSDPDPSNDESSATITVNFGAGPVAPVAAFTFEATGLEVAFTDTSTNDPTTWAWDFGDGAGTSDMQNPTYTYAADGTYTVSLTATNAGGSDTTTMDVTVADVGPVLDKFYFIPAAAKAEGNPGTFFVTDLAINNTGTEMASYQFLWLERGMDNSTPPNSATFTLGGGMTATYSDVLGEVFNAEDGALGALAVISNNSDLIFMSRTFNQGADGTFGQSIPGYAMSQLIPENMRMRIIFMLQNDDYRSNLGLMNGVGSPITVNFEIFGSDGTSLGTGSRELAAWSNTQINRVLNSYAPITGAYIDVWTTTPGGMFAAYGSVLDNLTDDPTTVLPQ
jgi:PKD repeat protein